MNLMLGLTEDEFAIGLWRISNKLTHADDELKPFRQLQSQRRDWLRFARQSLLISTVQAGHALEVSRGAFVKIESREETGQLTLDRLRAAAEAVGCELVYAIRPKDGLSFAEASWRRLAPDVNAKAERRHSPPQMRGHMKLSIAMRLLENEENLKRMVFNRQRQRFF